MGNYLNEIDFSFEEFSLIILFLRIHELLCKIVPVNICSGNIVFLNIEREYYSC